MTDMSLSRSTTDHPLSPLLAIAASLLATASIALATAASAQTPEYPTRAVQLVVGLPAGGGADVVARVVAMSLGDRLGQQVVVENRTGSGGLIAANGAAHAAPDGYTLLFGTVSYNAIFASLYKKLPYDPVNDFAPVSMLATYPLVLVVGASSPYATLSDFIAQARSAPGRLNYASAGHGTPLHLAMEMLKRRTDIDIVHVPYRGGVSATGDLISGQIHAIFDALPTQLANIRAGKVRALAVSGAARSPLLPDVPTMTEAGVADFDIHGWFALFTPSATPQPVLARLHAAVEAALGDPDVRQRLLQMGVDPMVSSPADLASFQRAEIARWGQAVRDSGASVE
jgi:tripartite-type tricarboxylate transporter receptor subunit TctC